jgi:phage tail sheath gpL-like
MPIVTNVPNTLLRPQTFHTFLASHVAGKLTSIPLSIALIGAKSSAGTATANTVYDMTGLTAVDGDGLFGQSSELAMMHRQSIVCANFFQAGPRVFCVPIAESAGVANVQTGTATGTTTAAGNLIIKIAGRVFTVGLSLGLAQNGVASAIAAEVQKRAPELPVVVTVATNVVTFTHPTKGINGVDVKIQVLQQVAGCTVAIATSAAGTAVTDHQPALDALSPRRYDGIVFANHASADITEILADIAVRWGASSKNWSLYFVGEMGTIGTATSLAAAGNDKALQIASMEGCWNTAGEMATTLAMMVFSRERINSSYDGVRVPLYPPADATIYTPAEVETALAAGLTPFTAVFDSTGAVTQNLARCERAVTTHTTTGSPAVPDDRVRDIGIPRTMYSVALQVDIAAAERFGADSNPDGVRQSSDTDKAIKKMWAGIARSLAQDQVFDPDQVEADITQTLVEHDSVTAGRTNVAMFYHYLGSQHQIVWQHNVTVP